jgi:hypothetical protein
LSPFAEEEMKSRLPTGLFVVAIGQFVAPLFLPPQMLVSISPVLWGLVVALFGLLGFYLLRRRAWARLATVFVQGFNILIRLLVLVSNIVKDQGGVMQTNYWMLGTFIVSMILSAIILYYVDLPDVQMLMR